MMPIGIDTSFLIGLLDSRDVWHSGAIRLQEAIATARLEPIYFDCTLAEAISTLARRLRERHRESELSGILDNFMLNFRPETITWILPDVPRLYEAAVQLVQSSGGELNFNDALIALACRERGIRVLASFDRDFDNVSGIIRVATADEVEKVVAASQATWSDEESAN
ncbi:MAG TPA: type II toxin-antitoxin system VapC family toxin [Blastocatellia bacterium]|nr:type II toxin-antitoxin system VapC family toxin [Blastocatellia bacterium]